MKAFNVKSNDPRTTSTDSCAHAATTLRMKQEEENFLLDFWPGMSTGVRLHFDLYELEVVISVDTLQNGGRSHCFSADKFNCELKQRVAASLNGNDGCLLGRFRVSTSCFPFLMSIHYCHRYLNANNYKYASSTFLICHSVITWMC